MHDREIAKIQMKIKNCRSATKACLLRSVSPMLQCMSGESGVDQLVEIIKVLGTPTREEIYAMNPNYTEFKFPKITAHPWSKVFSKRMPPDAVDLVCQPTFEGPPFM